MYKLFQWYFIHRVTTLQKNKITIVSNGISCMYTLMVYEKINIFLKINENGLSNKRL